MATRNNDPTDLTKNLGAASLARFNAWIAKIDVENAKRAKINADDYLITHVLVGDSRGTINTKVVRKLDLAVKNFYQVGGRIAPVDNYMKTLTGAQLADLFIEQDKAAKKASKEEIRT